MKALPALGFVLICHLGLSSVEAAVKVIPCDPALAANLRASKQTASTEPVRNIPRDLAKQLALSAKLKVSQNAIEALAKEVANWQVAVRANKVTEPPASLLQLRDVAILEGHIDKTNELARIAAQRHSIQMSGAIAQSLRVSQSKPKERPSRFPPRSDINSQVVNPVHAALDRLAKPLSTQPSAPSGQRLSDADKACAAAAESFKASAQKVLHAGSPEEFVSWWDELHTGALPEAISVEARDAWQSAREYAAKCMTEEPVQGAKSIDFDRRVGSLGKGASKRFCTATRLDSTTLITARHCVMSGGDTKPEQQVSELDLSTLWFEFPADEDFRYQVCAFGTKQIDASYEYSNDVVLLKMADPLDKLEPLSIAERNPVRGTQLVLPGLNLIQLNSDIEFRLSRTRVSGCEVVESQSCLLHSCQSLPGMSGAPMFAVQPDSSIQPTLVGIHIGGRNFELERLSVCTSDANAYPNTKNIGLGAQQIVKTLGGK
jgi:Trypsin-like peptidase domain